MSKDRQRLFEYLEHILAAIGRIDRYVAGLNETGFLENDLIQDAVIRNLEVIGEALHNIQTHSPGFVQGHSQLPWDQAYGMRNALSHGYFKIDLRLVWKTIERDLPKLQQQVQKIQQSPGSPQK